MLRGDRARTRCAANHTASNDHNDHNDDNDGDPGHTTGHDVASTTSPALGTQHHNGRDHRHDQESS